MPDYLPSPYQQAIYDFIERGRGNGIANAVAGAGKSTTIKTAFKRLRTNDATFLAFNKSIVDELKADGINAKTLNSLGFGALMRARNVFTVAPRLESQKTSRLIDAYLTMDAVKKYGGAIAKLVGLAKSVGIVPNTPALAGRGLHPLTRDTNDAWYELIDRYDIQLGDHPEASEDELVDYARTVLEKGLTDLAMIDFDDQKYLPVVMDLPVYRSAWLFVDECQDLNAVDRALIQKALKPGGRLFAVGDPHQAIYAFRGADTNSYDLVKRDFSCQEFPLSVCYRCPTSVVALAKEWVPQIEAAPGAPEGVVDQIAKYKGDIFKAGDLVICRNNAPLIKLAYRLMAARVPVVVMGRDFGKSILALVTKLSKKAKHEGSLAVWLAPVVEAYRDKEVEAAQARKMESKAERINDMCEAILAVIDSSDAGDIAGFTAELEKLFSDEAKRNAVVLSSIHKAKGGQAQRVFILDWYLLPSKYARSVEARQVEANLQYVAVTRAQSYLGFIDTDGFQSEVALAA